METLHIYAQEIWHDKAYIAGTPEALTLLRDAINGALKTGTGRAECFVCDGEGYRIEVVATSDENMDKMGVPYTDPTAMASAGDNFGPWSLLRPTSEFSGWRLRQPALSDVLGVLKSRLWRHGEKENEMQRWTPIAGCAGQPEGTHITWADHCAEIERLTAERNNTEKREYEVLGRANALEAALEELVDLKDMKSEAGYDVGDYLARKGPAWERAREILRHNVLADRREPIGEASNERSECGRAPGYACGLKT